MSWVLRRPAIILQRWLLLQPGRRHRAHGTDSATAASWISTRTPSRRALIPSSSLHIPTQTISTMLHSRSYFHTAAIRRAANTGNASQASAVNALVSAGRRSIATTAIPRLAFRLAWRLPLAAGIGGGAYVIAKVDAARKSVYSTVEDISTTLGNAFGTVGEAVGVAGMRAGETFDEAAQVGKGAWLGIKGYVESIFAAREDSKNSSEGSDNKRPETPERLAKAAAVAASMPLFQHDDERDQDPLSANPADLAANDLMMLTKKLIEIRSILLTIDHADGLQLPAIVVVGSQSSGKSSVLEAIVGREFLPKGNNMVTRRPIELTLIHSARTLANPNPDTYAEFPLYSPGVRITDFGTVQKILYDHNMAVPAGQAVSSVPIELRIYSPNVPDLSLVDLPGYIELSSMDQPDSLKEEITNLCEKYIKEPNIILAVCAADVDLANSPALRASRRVDPLGMRTLGVVTKMDLVEPQRGVDILTDRRYPLVLGYVGVVCKAVAQSRDGREVIRARKADSEGLIGPVRQQEQAFFGQNASFFSREGVQVTTDLLKRRLMHVLEESMGGSLASVSNNVALELEEAKYQFKVQYNDRSVTPESYLQETLDHLKRRLNSFSQGYSKNQVRTLLKHHLDEVTMDVLAQIYWQDSSENGSMQALAVAAQTPARPVKQPSIDDGMVTKTEIDAEALWRHKLDAATSALTKSGLGRASTQLVVQALRSHITQLLTKEEPLLNHTEMSERINNFSDAILRDRYAITSEQVENSIKPFKYEVELDTDGKEWEKGRAQSIKLLEREIEMCHDAYNSIKEAVGGSRRLQHAMQHVTDLADREKLRQAARTKALYAAKNGEDSGSDVVAEDMLDPARSILNPALMAKAREANFLSGRSSLLKVRLAALKSRQCRNYTDNTSQAVRQYCPEAFLNVVADKLASTAVMFINIELLAEYFYLFPREIETKLGYNLSHEEIVSFARENPRFRQHLDLQERKEKLEMVTEKLNALLKLQQERQGPMRNVPTTRPTPGRRFGLF